MKRVEADYLVPHWLAWFYAIRPKTLTTAVVPVIVATSLAHGSIEIAFFALLSILSMQVGTNLINDAIDFKKGTDTQERLGPRRVTQSGLIPFKTVYKVGVITFFLAIVSALPLMATGGWPIVLLVLLSVAVGYLYTGGPFPLSYHGLGDLFVFLFFGLAGTLGIFYIQSHHITLQAFLAGVQIGLLATALIAINNLRDGETDAKANKKTLPVRFGINAGKWEITLLLLLPYLLSFVWLLWGAQLAFLLPSLTLPFALQIVRNIWEHPPSELYNQFLGMSALLHLAFGILLALGVGFVG